MQNGDLPSPSGDEFESANFSIQPEDELPILKVEDILRGFERVAKPSQDDDGGDMLLKSSADMLLKATMYPASYDRLKKRLQTTVKAWPPSEATMANLAEMLVHWVCLLTLSTHTILGHSGVNPLPTIGNSLKKQKSLYKVLTPSIKPPIIHFIGLWELMMHICIIGW